MATSMAGSGTVASIFTSRGVYGTINVDDETDDVLNVTDPTFTSPTYTVGEWVSFTINTDDNGVSTISGVSALATTGPIPPITGNYTADIVALPGQVYTITGAGTIASGNLTINGGKVIVEKNAQVTPPTGSTIAVNGGIMVARGGGKITGNAIGINAGGSMKAVNGGSVTGNSIGVNNGGRMIAGNKNGAGTIATTPGTLTIQGIRALRVANDGTSAING